MDEALNAGRAGKSAFPGVAVEGLMDDKPARRKFHPVYLWLAVPFVALLWVPFFNRVEPALFGIPFFYWYQMAWTILGACCILPVYLYEERRRS